MTPQDFFDIVAPAILEQNAKSIDSVGVCLYASDGGLNCGVGIVLKELGMDRDELRALDVVGDVNSIFIISHEQEAAEAARLKAKDILEGCRSLAIEVQELHDKAECGEWRIGLAKLARVYGLDSGCINE